MNLELIKLPPDVTRDKRLSKFLVTVEEVINKLIVGTKKLTK